MKNLEPAPWILVPEILNIMRRTNWPDSITAYNVLNGLTELNEKFSDFPCRLFTPGGTIDDEATFVIISPSHRKELHVHTLSTDLEGFAEVLAKNSYIDWTKSLMISCIHERMFPVLDHLERILPNIKRVDCPVISYHISNEGARKVQFEVPDDVALKTLTLDHAELVNNLWPHGQTEETLLAVTDMIKMRESIGVFNKKTDEILAWSLYGEYGGAGVLHVRPEYHRKGYGQIALGKITRILGEKGFDPHAFITLHNTASKGLFTKLGYQPKYKASWTIFEYSNN